MAETDEKLLRAQPLGESLDAHRSAALAELSGPTRVTRCLPRP